jgi:hypothetical protein
MSEAPNGSVDRRRRLNYPMLRIIFFFFILKMKIIDKHLALQLNPEPSLPPSTYAVNKIIDPDLSVLQELTRKAGFRSLHHRMGFFGICPEYQDN